MQAVDYPAGRAPAPIPPLVLEGVLQARLRVAARLGRRAAGQPKDTERNAGKPERTR